MAFQSVRTNQLSMSREARNTYELVVISLNAPGTIAAYRLRLVFACMHNIRYGVASLGAEPLEAVPATADRFLPPSPSFPPLENPKLLNFSK